MYEPVRVSKYGFTTVPYQPDIPDPVIVVPPTEDLTEGVYIPPSVRPNVNIHVGSDLSLSRQLNNLYSAHYVRRWRLPSWGWVGVRTYYGHSATEWETFRQRLVSAYSVTRTQEGDKFRVLWIEDGSTLEGADEAHAREAFQAWFLDHSDPPDGHYSIVPTVQDVWSGYETLVCLVADKESIDSVLNNPLDALDAHASIKVLEREFNIEHMREWAPKLLGRYTGSFKISPEFLPNLDGSLDEDASYGQHGSPSTWYLKSERTADGVLREGTDVRPEDDYGRDHVNLGVDSDEEERDWR